MNKAPIAVLDSGVGGISVLKAAVKVMPNENFIYFGDSKNAPYGTKTSDEVRALTEKNVEMLLQMGAKAIVIACNTATSAAAEMLRNKYKNVAIIGIEPALKPAVIHNGGKRVIVMATPMTLKEKKFAKLFNQYGSLAETILLPCEGLMEFVERGELSGDRLDNYLKTKFAPFMDKKISAVVLGCTHYPFVKNAIINAIGYTVEIDDGALGTALETKHQICERNCTSFDDKKGTVEFFNSSDDENMIVLSKKLFETEIV